MHTRGDEIGIGYQHFGLDVMRPISGCENKVAAPRGGKPGYTLIGHDVLVRRSRFPSGFSAEAATNTPCDLSIGFERTVALMYSVSMNISI
jgi:hypothetical protein